ncbi:MAG: hypothetical protein L6264_04295 [Weeksellaceae bacterium]|nr:hypothetical protein [Weeksellaceae bacterium]
MRTFYQITFCFLLINSIQAQNIFSAIHLNDRYKIKQEKPVEKIESTTTFYNTYSTEKRKEITILNSKFHVLKEERYNSDGEEIFKMENEYQFDSLQIGNKTTRKIPLIGSEVIKSSFEYDSNNFLTKIVKRNNKNQITETVNFENDEKGNPILLKINDGEFGFEKATYDYKNNTYSTFVYNADNELKSSDKSIRLDFDIPTEDHIFNEFGDLIESKNFKFEYRYDKFGNWTKQIRYKIVGKNKIKDAEFTRKITYK